MTTARATTSFRFARRSERDGRMDSDAVPKDADPGLLIRALAAATRENAAIARAAN
jgi:hypothetical protein